MSGLKQWSLLLLVLNASAGFERVEAQERTRSRQGVHLPLVLASIGTPLERRGKTGSTGLGDYLDVSYNVLIEISGIPTSLLIDTGSSDLWVVGDSCTTGCTANIPLFPHSIVNSTGIDVSLLYGDSGTGTYAYGVIGSGDVDLAEIRVPGQQFALINRTNARVAESGSSGIFGLGFPINSVLWNTMFVDQYLGSGSSSYEAKAQILAPRRTLRNRHHSSLKPKPGPRQSRFPDLSFLDPDPAHTDHPSVRAAESLSDKVFRSYSDIAPFFGRLIATKEIDPIFAVTLQRDTVDIGGNVGQLSIGSFPPGVQNDSFTWVPVRGYTRSQGGLPPPLDSPGEIYPIAWEIPVDDVYLNGEILPRSNLSSPSISLSALIDTGNSLIRGPEDVIGEIDRRIGTNFPCSQPHTLAFSIGGKLFPVDPRDFLFQEYTNSVSHCVANVVATDPPAVGGYLFSWSLGTPFLKSVISAFYFGDLQYPSRDPPRIGLASTVPQDAPQKLEAAVKSAVAGDGSFPFSFEPAPSGAQRSVSSSAKAPEPTEKSNPSTEQGQTSRAMRIGCNYILCLVGQGFVLWTLYLQWGCIGL